MMNAAKLRARLAGPTALLCPGVYDALSALLAGQAGFEALYLSGASVAYTQLAAPDIGLVAMTELAGVVARIGERSTLPLIVDADNGFGNAVNVQRTVRVLERAGAAALQLEDQSMPKRCGHLAGKTLIPRGEMVGKIRAALDARDHALVIARTDAIAVEGFDRAMDRADAYVGAGADVLFVEAPESHAQMQAIATRFATRLPLLANMVEGGRTPLATTDELGAMGFRLVLFPGGTVRSMVRALQDYFATLRRDGTTQHLGGQMLDFSELQSVLGTDALLRAGAAYAEEA